jgi:hypothetical protein
MKTNERMYAAVSECQVFGDARRRSMPNRYCKDIQHVKHDVPFTSTILSLRRKTENAKTATRDEIVKLVAAAHAHGIKAVLLHSERVDFDAMTKIGQG